MSKISKKMLQNLKRENYDVEGHLNKDFATKEELGKLTKELQRRLGEGQRQEQRQNAAHTTSRTHQMAKHGIENIGRSLNSPVDSRRPRISQMPARRRDIGISTNMDLSRLKDSRFGQSLKAR